MDSTELNRLPRNHIRTQCDLVPASVQLPRSVPKKPRRKRQPGNDAPVAAPLPITENGAKRSVAGEPALVMTERQFPQIICGELMSLIETRKSPLQQRDQTDSRAKLEVPAEPPLELDEPPPPPPARRCRPRLILECPHLKSRLRRIDDASSNALEKV